MRCLLLLALAGCVESRDFMYVECHDVPIDDLPEQCGTPCEVYCCTLMANCGRVLALTADECLEQCEEIPQDGEDGDLRGDTLQCRMTYAIHGEENVVYCPYATPWSTAACED